MKDAPPATIMLPPETFATIVMTPMFCCAAIVAALAEARLLDPMKVAAWADVFAKGQSLDMPAGVRAGLADQVGQFAALIRAMATVPEGAGRG